MRVFPSQSEDINFKTPVQEPLDREEQSRLLEVMKRPSRKTKKTKAESSEPTGTKAKAKGSTRKPRGKAKAKAKAKATGKNAKAKGRNVKPKETQHRKGCQQPAAEKPTSEGKSSSKRAKGESGGEKATFARRYEPKSAASRSWWAALSKAFREQIRDHVQKPSKQEDHCLTNNKQLMSCPCVP